MRLLLKVTWILPLLYHQNSVKKTMKIAQNFSTVSGGLAERPVAIGWTGPKGVL
jgi:hypothetical protein